MTPDGANFVKHFSLPRHDLYPDKTLTGPKIMKWFHIRNQEVYEFSSSQILNAPRRTHVLEFSGSQVLKFLSSQILNAPRRTQVLT